MKTLLFMLVLPVLSFADSRVFDCSFETLNHKSLLVSDFALTAKSSVLLIESKKNWSLTIGNETISTLDMKGPALEKQVSSDKTYVNYEFWVDGSYEYVLKVNPVTYKGKLIWWGMGEAELIGNLNCEVSEI